MAKDHREQKPAKVRIFFGFAEVEGGDHTVQEGVRSIAAAVVRAVQPNQFPARPVKSLPAAPPTGDGKAEEATLFDQEEPVDGSLVEDVDPTVGGATATNATERAPRPPKKAPTYTHVKDLNLRPADKQSLRDFFAEKKPGDLQEQATVFIFYLQKILGITGIGANHLYDCFQDVSKRVPKDILQVARNTSSRKGWIDTSDADNLRVLPKGENLVNHDLPPKGSAATA
jgi:hypothetical protein